MPPLVVFLGDLLPSHDSGSRLCPPREASNFNLGLIDTEESVGKAHWALSLLGLRVTLLLLTLVLFGFVTCLMYAWGVRETEALVRYLWSLDILTLPPSP